MSFTNAQLAAKMAELIAYWQSFNKEYAGWLAGAAGGGDNSDGRYPLTDWFGNTSLVASPLQLQADVDTVLTGAGGHADSAAADASAAAVSATTATAQAGLADAARIAAEAAQALAAVDAANAADSRNTSVAQANLAKTRADNAAESETNVSTIEANVINLEAQAAASADAAATFDPSQFAALDVNGKVDAQYLPSLIITDTFPVTSDSEMLALDAQRGDVAINSTSNTSYILKADDPSVLANWQQILTPADGVQTVNGLSGSSVELDYADLAGAYSADFNNTIGIRGRTTGGALFNLIRRDGDNRTEIGTNAYTTLIRSVGVPQYSDGSTIYDLLHTGGDQDINGGGLTVSGGQINIERPAGQNMLDLRTTGIPGETRSVVVAQEDDYLRLRHSGSDRFAGIRIDDLDSPRFTFARGGDFTATGTVYADAMRANAGTFISRASTGNAHYWMKAGDDSNKGLLFWDAGNNLVKLRGYNADASAYAEFAVDGDNGRINFYNDLLIQGHKIIFGDTGDGTNVDYISYDDNTNTYWFHADTTTSATVSKAILQAMAFVGRDAGEGLKVGLGNDNANYNAADLRFNGGRSVLYLDDAQLADGFAIRKHTGADLFSNIFEVDFDGSARTSKGDLLHTDGDQEIDKSLSIRGGLNANTYIRLRNSSDALLDVLALPNDNLLRVGNKAVPMRIRASNVPDVWVGESRAGNVLHTGGNQISGPLRPHGDFDVNGSTDGENHPAGLYVADLGTVTGSTNNPTYTAAIIGARDQSRFVGFSATDDHIYGFRAHSTTRAEGGYQWFSRVKEADTWTTARTLSLTGDVTGSISIDGSGDVSLDTSLSGSGLNISNWDTAYGWGDHASAGYLTSFTESDPTVPAHVKSITSGEKSNWNTAYGWGDHAGLYAASGHNHDADYAPLSHSHSYLPLSGGTLTGAVTLNASGGTNQIKDGTGDGASYATHNFRIKGWYGMGMEDNDGGVHGFYDFRLGKWDVKDGYYVDGQEVYHAGNDGSGSGLDADYLRGYGPATDGTASTLALRNTAGDIYARLFRSTYQNQSTISGAIAYRVSTTDNYIRYCSSPSAVRGWLELSGKTTVSSSGPSGGNDGDIWYQV